VAVARRVYAAAPCIRAVSIDLSDLLIIITALGGLASLEILILKVDFFGLHSSFLMTIDNM
jgi:hypothetical protein